MCKQIKEFVEQIGLDLSNGYKITTSVQINKTISGFFYGEIIALRNGFPAGYVLTEDCDTEDLAAKRTSEIEAFIPKS